MRAAPRAASVWPSEACFFVSLRGGSNVIARLVRSSDFERVLRTRTRISSAHFAVHHVADLPGAASKPAKNGLDSLAGTVKKGELSTGRVPIEVLPVDDLSRPPFEGVWLGAVVPKRHARRSVTRTLLKRQIRAVVGCYAPRLTNGLWVVRLRAPFDKTRFVSAASDELRAVARTELESLFDGAVKRLAPGA
jgi:ribonuclease P protein component